MTTVDIKRTPPITMDIGGSKVSISFAIEPNIAVALLVKKVLMDSYSQKSVKK